MKINLFAMLVTNDRNSLKCVTEKLHTIEELKVTVCSATDNEYCEICEIKPLFSSAGMCAYGKDMKKAGILLRCWRLAIVQRLVAEFEESQIQM